MQIGVTNWASQFDDTSARAPSTIDPETRKRIYTDTSNVIWGHFSSAYAKVEGEANKAYQAWLKKNPPPKPARGGAAPAGPATPAPTWEEQPDYAVHQLKLEIADAYRDAALKARITNHVVAGDADLVAGADSGRITKRGRVLNRWYSLVKRSPGWFSESGWYQEAGMSEAQMKALPAAEVKRRLLVRINAGLDEAEARGLASANWEQNPGVD